MIDSTRLGPDRVQRRSEPFQGLSCDPLALVDEPEEQVLGAYVVVVEKARFLLGEHNDAPGPVREAFKHPVDRASQTRSRSEW